MPTDENPEAEAAVRTALDEKITDLSYEIVNALLPVFTKLIDERDANDIELQTMISSSSVALLVCSILTSIRACDPDGSLTEIARSTLQSGIDQGMTIAPEASVQ